MQTETLSLETYDNEQIEAQWDRPSDPTHAVVFCHPHPQHSGTMTAPLMNGVTERLVAAAFSVLRFNFRGVGASSGAWDNGIGEIHDVDAAVEQAQGEDLPVAICGWSFGGATSLRWQAVSKSDLPWVGISPPVPPNSEYNMPGPADLSPARRTIIIGDRDQLINVEDSRAYADALGAEFHLMTGSDHFFYFREDRVAELVIAGLRRKP
jgi:hypothetical protein